MLSKQDIIRYLEDLNNELRELGINGELILFGGASMCLVYDARTSTKDIDAVYEPKPIINELVQKIAVKYKLEDNWLNDSVKGFVSNTSEIQEFMTFTNLKVHTVTAQYLLAMKLLASRGTGSKDFDDIKYLVSCLGINTSQEVYDLLSKYYPNNKVLPKVQYVIEELFLGDDDNV